MDSAVAYPCTCRVPDLTEDDYGTIFCLFCGGIVDK